MGKPTFNELEAMRGWIAAQNDLLLTLVAWVPNKPRLISAFQRARELGTTQLLNSSVSDAQRAAYEAATQAIVAELQRFLPTGESPDSQSPL